MRAVRYFIYLALGGALLFGASWAAATFAVGTLLGAPPPRMGEERLSFEYRGVQRLRGHPIAWVFRYGPTSLPGARGVSIYVSPTGRLIDTDPPNLPDLVEAFQQGRLNP